MRGLQLHGDHCSDQSHWMYPILKMPVFCHEVSGVHKE